jgi:hypothetical protein
MDSPDGFVSGDLDPTIGKLTVVAVSSDGATAFEVIPGSPCDCLCAGLLSPDGVLYGPATWQDAQAAFIALPSDDGWAFGLLGKLRENSPTQARPLSVLQQQM